MKINYSIQLQASKTKLVITLFKGDITITIRTKARELWRLYKIRVEDINLKVVKVLIEDNLLPIVKSYNFDSKVEEWTTTDKIFTFKKEEGLIICVVNSKPDDFIYLKEDDLTENMKFKLTLAEYEELKVSKNKAKDDALVISQNINLDTKFNLFDELNKN